jgi:hypothetical protein
VVRVGVKFAKCRDRTIRARNPRWSARPVVACGMTVRLSGKTRLMNCAAVPLTCGMFTLISTSVVCIDFGRVSLREPAASCMRSLGDRPRKAVTSSPQGSLQSVARPADPIRLASRRLRPTRHPAALVSARPGARLGPILPSVVAPRSVVGADLPLGDLYWWAVYSQTMRGTGAG